VEEHERRAFAATKDVEVDAAADRQSFEAARAQRAISSVAGSSRSCTEIPTWPRPVTRGMASSSVARQRG